MTKSEYLLRELRSKLWLKPAIVGLAAIGLVTGAYAGAGILPEKLEVGVKRDILLNLLEIMAATMLTVATFSVAAMVSAYNAVSTTATPRAARIVMEDKSSQNALTSFLAAFIYAIVALVALSLLDYGGRGRLLLFAGYAAMVLWVLVSFIRWVDRVSKLGRMGDTLDRVEAACQEAFSSPESVRSLGGATSDGEEVSGEIVQTETSGYVQNVDMAALDEIAKELGGRIRLLIRPGAFVLRTDNLAVVRDGKPPDGETVERIRDAIHVGDSRRVGTDPRFGLILLAETADRALSPAVNDPGTAIAVLGIQLRLLETWQRTMEKAEEVKYPNVEVPPLDPEDLLDDAFIPISRDGAAMFEVGSRLQKALGALARAGQPGLSAAAVRHSRLAMGQAENALKAEEHREILRGLAAAVAKGEIRSPAAGIEPVPPD